MKNHIDLLSVSKRG